MSVKEQIAGSAAAEIKEQIANSAAEVKEQIANSAAEVKEQIAKRVAAEIADGAVVNLGIGLPELVANYISKDKEVWFQSENGIIGVGGAATEEEADKNVINAGARHVTVRPGGCFFDSAASFGIIRGGHVDVTVLGVLQVDAEGSFASHKIPGRRVPGMGGAMDLVSGVKKVILATTHTKKDAKTIVNQLSLPATGIKKANLIVTELAVIRVTEDGLVLEEVAEGHTPEEVQALTEPRLILGQRLKANRG